MEIYVVTYDLHGNGKDYSGLIKELESFRVYLHVLESSWLVQAVSAQSIFDAIRPHLDSNAEVLIIKTDKDYLAYLDEESLKWLRGVIG
ncbi:hypothetical protein [Paenibacillus massiliensis]|uniref:hypothetical protein n=1 Tax=Paenibacillus massiliensis TaxID=225917 RepID=UPI00048E4A28|nr:hypothetical protein [Paenibacillus massiliensis]